MEKEIIKLNASELETIDQKEIRKVLEERADVVTEKLRKAGKVVIARSFMTHEHYAEVLYV